MSGFSENPPLAGTAREIKRRAAAFVIGRHSRPDWSDDDQAALDSWLCESTANAVAYWRMDEAWQRTYRLSVLSMGKAQRRAAFAARIRPFLTGAAAALILIGVFAAGATVLLAPVSHDYSTPVGGHKIITLADGTSIELNTNTAVRVTFGRHARKVVLEKGEAYFQVHHNPARPFVVRASGHRITDIGTKFLVRKAMDRLEVAVSEGRVALSGRAGAKPALLKAGDVALATTDTVSVTHQSAQALARALGWRHGVVVFDDTTLADAAAEFNRYNAKKIVIADPAVAWLSLSGRFPTKDVEGFTDIAVHVFGLKIARRGNEIIIAR
jgi:transmembrane sensor